MSCSTLALNGRVVFMQRTSIHVAAQHSWLHATLGKPRRRGGGSDSGRTLLDRCGNGDMCSLAERLLLLSAVLEG